MYGEVKMNEASANAVSNGSETPSGPAGKERNRVSSQGKPLRLTITVEKIDRVMADVQTQIDDLHRYMSNLKLARARIAMFHAKGYGSGTEGAHLSPSLRREGGTQRI
jgi:hypothetical protein